MFETPFSPISEWRTVRKWATHVAIDLHAGRRDRDSAIEKRPPWRLGPAASLTGDNLIDLFFGPSWPDADRARLIGVADFWLRRIRAPLSALCVFVTTACWRQPRERLMPVLMLLWFVVQGLFPLSVNEGRHRKRFEGLLVAQ